MNIPAKQTYQYEHFLHYSMCMIGGFCGSYALLLRGNFGSAQTANLIQLFISISEVSLLDAFVRISALGIFIISLFVSSFLSEKYTEQSVRICLLVEVIGVCMIGLIPKGANDLLALLPLFALTAFQWGVFNGTKNYVSPTLFSTGNIRQCIQAWMDYYLTATKSSKDKGTFYAYTLLNYHVGVLAGIGLIAVFGAKSILFCLAPLLINLKLESAAMD
ncbi:YoaK family protein [Marinilactibacillus kalidii]|uniref:YoaK family protein n=1 Tax=Marinilactibacillus kalidii TaxID=2820274 RepID=UPI001ABE8774|nr:YoaK family protein [Marinilactibacillus kalidii]